MKRFKEPSTWAGLGMLFQMLKVVVPPQYHTIIDGVTTVAGSVAVAMSEKGAAVKGV